MNWKASPSYMSQGRHCGYYWHLMAHGVLSRISRAGLLCRSPSTWLSDFSYSPLLCGAQWLLWAHSISATSSHSSACRVEQKWGTHGRKGWEINAKTTQLLGNQPWVQVQSPLWDTEGSLYFLPISWAPKRRFTHTWASPQPPPGPETTSKSGLRQRPSVQTRPGHI